MTILAFALAVLALASGLWVVGSGSQFQYSVRDLIRGLDTAVLYVWITASTIFTLAHVAVLFEFGYAYGWGDKDASTPKWMAIHAFVGLLFVTAHLMVDRLLKDREDHPPRYLWGASHA